MIRKQTLYALFLVSGASALVYEVVWSRLLGFVFGNTAYAVSAVLACYMGGMALGALLGGRVAGRLRNEVVAYAVLEVVIGVYGLLSGPLLRELPALYALIAPDATAGMPGRTAARVGIAVLALLLPTALMGATLPILSRALARIDADFRRSFGVLYAANLLGAGVGCLAAGFVLIEWLGLQGTLAVAAVGNFAVAGWAWRTHRSGAARGTVPADAAGPPAPVVEGTSLAGASLLCVGVVGFTSLASELVWTRVLTLYVGNSVYAFSYMLVVFLVGLSVGSYLAHRLAGDREEVVRVLGGLQHAIGVAVAASLLLFLYPIPVKPPPSVFGSPKLDAGLVLALNVVIATLVMGLQPVLFGAVLPIAVQQLARHPEGVGRPVARLYAVNTVGNILGSLLTGFVLIPWVGMRGMIFLLAFANAAAGLLLSAMRPGRAPRLRVMPLAGAASVAVLYALVPTDLFRDLYEQQFGRIVFYKEGASDTVMVIDDGKTITFPGATYPSRWLYFSDRRGTAGTATLAGNALYAQIPLLLHPDPDEVLVICFGSGNTAASAATHPGVSVDIAELSPEVFEAGAFFPSNRGVLERPNVRAFAEDGRNFLLASSRRYDVITLEPPFLDMAGVVNLYTREFYERARSRLSSDGVLAQWFPMGSFSEYESRLVLRTFLEVFPNTTVWEVPPGHVHWLLVGTVGETRIDLARISEAFELAEVGEDLRRIGVANPADLLGHYLFSGARLHDLLGGEQGGGVITDDHSIVDFSLVRKKFSYKVGTLSLPAQARVVHEWSRHRDLPEAVDGGIPRELAERIREIQRSRRERFAEQLHAQGVLGPGS